MAREPRPIATNYYTAYRIRSNIRISFYSKLCAPANLLAFQSEFGSNVRFHDTAGNRYLNFEILLYFVCNVAELK